MIGIIAGVSGGVLLVLGLAAAVAYHKSSRARGSAPANTKPPPVGMSGIITMGTPMGTHKEEEGPPLSVSPSAGPPPGFSVAE